MIVVGVVQIMWLILDRYVPIKTLGFSKKLTHACSTKQLISMIAAHCHEAKSANPNYMIKEAAEEGRGPSGIFQHCASEEVHNYVKVLIKLLLLFFFYKF